MAMDIKRSWFGDTTTNEIATGSAVSEEGQLLQAVLEDGVEKILPATAVGGETIVGFARFRQADHTSRPFIESDTVPASAPYTLETRFNNLVVGQVRVYDATNAVDLTVVVGAPAAGEVQVVHATGALAFNVAEAGVDLVIYYRHNLSLQQALFFYYEAPTNYPDPNFFTQVGVGKGKGQIFTYHYDAAQDYSVNPVLKAGADGIVTVGGAGSAIPGARVISVPTEADPALGIEFLV